MHKPLNKELYSIWLALVFFLCVRAAYAVSAQDYCNTAFAYYRDKHYTEASALLEQALKLDAQLPSIYYLRGLIRLHSLNQPEEARMDFDKAIELDPGFGVVYAERGNLEQSQHHETRAIADYTQAIKLNGTVPGLYQARGQIYSSIGRYQEALKDYTRCLELKPEQPKILALRAEAYIKLKQWDKALPDLDKTLSISPNAIGYASRAWVNFNLGNYQAALTDYNRTTAEQPGQWRPYQGRGYIYEKSKRYDEAIAELNKALKLKPGEGDTLEVRGICYEQLKQNEKALADYTAALKGEPEFKARVYYRRAILYKKMDELARAVADADEALKIEPSYEEVRLFRIRCHRLQGFTLKALSECNALLKSNPKDAALLVERGRNYEALGDDDKAREDFSAAHRFNPRYNEKLKPANREAQSAKTASSSTDSSIPGPLRDLTSSTREAWVKPFVACLVKGDLQKAGEILWDARWKCPLGHEKLIDSCLVQIGDEKAIVNSQMLGSTSEQQLLSAIPVLDKFGRHTASLALAKELSLRKPSDPAAQRRVADAYLRLKNFDEALTAFKTADELEPSNPHNLAGIIHCYEQLDSQDDIKKARQEFLTRFPRDSEAWKYELSASQADSSNDKNSSAGQPEKQTTLSSKPEKKVDDAAAVQRSQEQANKNPSSAFAQVKLAHQYLKLEKYSDALAAFKKADELAPSDPQNLMGIIGCATQLGLLEEVLSAKKDFVARFPADSRAQGFREQISYYKGDYSKTREREKQQAQKFQDRARFPETMMPLKVYAPDIAALAQEWKVQPDPGVDYSALLQQACQEWSSATNNKVSFQITSNPDKADITVAWVNEPSQMVHSFAAGVTSLAINDRGQRRMTITLLLPTDRQPDNSKDFYEVCLHELGHALGLGHSSDPSDIMYFSALGTKEERRDLSATDRQRINAIYK